MKIFYSPKFGSKYTKTQIEENQQKRNVKL